MQYQVIPVEFAFGTIEFSIVLSARLVHDPEVDQLARRLIQTAQGLVSTVVAPLLRHKGANAGEREDFVIAPEDEIIDYQDGAVICSAMVSTGVALSPDCTRKIVVEQVFDIVRREVEAHAAEDEAKYDTFLRGLCVEPSLAA